MKRINYKTHNVALHHINNSLSIDTLLENGALSLFTIVSIL